MWRSGNDAADSHVAHRFCDHGVFIANKYIARGTGYFHAAGFHARSNSDTERCPDFADAYNNFRHRNDH